MIESNTSSVAENALTRPPTCELVLFDQGVVELPAPALGELHKSCPWMVAAIDVCEYFAYPRSSENVERALSNLNELGVATLLTARGYLALHLRYPYEISWSSQESSSQYSPYADNPDLAFRSHPEILRLARTLESTGKVLIIEIAIPRGMDATNVFVFSEPGFEEKVTVGQVYRFSDSTKDKDRGG